MSKTTDLNGVRGWLMFYLIGPGTIGGLMSLMGGVSIDDSIVTIAAFIQLALALAGFNMREAWVRTAHLFYWGSSTMLNVIGFLVVVDFDPDAASFFVGSGIGAAVWWAYWVRSKRVKITYRVVSERDAELTLLDD